MPRFALKPLVLSYFGSTYRLALSSTEEYQQFTQTKLDKKNTKAHTHTDTATFTTMVYAPANGHSGDASMPQDAHDEDAAAVERNDAQSDHDNAFLSHLHQQERVECLRHAVETQEARVRLLRARKVARERLLLRIQSLLATGDALAAHGDVEQAVRHAEESFQQLLQTEQITATTTTTTTTTTVLSHGPDEVREGEVEGRVNADPLARIFHSGVEAQLAAVPDAALPPCSLDAVLLKDDENEFDATSKNKRDHSSKTNKADRKKKLRKLKKETRAAQGAALHVDPASSGMAADASPETPPPAFPPSATKDALLAKSASRAEAGTAAMLAALESLHLALQATPTKVQSGGAGSRVADNSGNVGEHSNRESATRTEKTQDEEPAWLRVVESDDEDGITKGEEKKTGEVNKANAHTQASTPQPPPQSTQASSACHSRNLSDVGGTEVYSDDFETRSSSSETSAVLEDGDLKEGGDGEGGQRASP